MSEIGITLLIIYIAGIFIWMLVEKRFFPWEEGEYRIEFDGAHEIDEDLHNSESVCRSVLWPLCLSFILILLPIVILDKIFNKL